MGSILTNKMIMEYGLITSDTMCNDSLSTASYDLRLGDRHLVYDESGNVKLVMLGEKAEEEIKKFAEDYKEQGTLLNPALVPTIQQTDRDVLTIPAYGSAVIQMHETLDTLSVAADKGRKIVGRFDLKLKTIYKGLISQQATQVEPYYRGKLFCFIYNFSSTSINLKHLQTVATIEFSELEEGVKSVIKEGGEIKGIDEWTVPHKFSEGWANGYGIDDIRWFYSQGYVPSDSGLAQLYRKVNSEISNDFEKYLDKASTEEKLRGIVERCVERNKAFWNNAFTVIASIVGLAGAGYAVGVETEIKAFREELDFFVSQEIISDSGGLQSYSELTQKITDTRKFYMVILLGIGIAIVVILTAIYFVKYLLPDINKSMNSYEAKVSKYENKKKIEDWENYREEERKKEKERKKNEKKARQNTIESKIKKVQEYLKEKNHKKAR